MMRSRKYNGVKSDSGFFVAPFVFDGGLEGIKHRRFDEMSSKWMRVCRDFLERHGAKFDASWNGPLSHIRIQFESDSGAALFMLFAHGRPAVSVVLMSGRSPATDCYLEGVFIDFLRRIKIVATTAQSPEPFREISNIKERPLMVVVHWGDEEISERDHLLIRDLALHMAGAFFEAVHRHSCE